jgi:hypothetical protein
MRFNFNEDQGSSMFSLRRNDQHDLNDLSFDVVL